MVDVAVPAAGSGSVRLTGSGSASGREISEVRVIGDWVYFQLDGWEDTRPAGGEVVAGRSG